MIREAAPDHPGEGDPVPSGVIVNDVKKRGVGLPKPFETAAQTADRLYPRGTHRREACLFAIKERDKDWQRAVKLREALHQAEIEKLKEANQQLLERLSDVPSKLALDEKRRSRLHDLVQEEPEALVGRNLFDVLGDVLERSLRASDLAMQQEAVELAMRLQYAKQEDGDVTDLLDDGERLA